MRTWRQVQLVIFLCLGLGFLVPGWVGDEPFWDEVIGTSGPRTSVYAVLTVVAFVLGELTARSLTRRPPDKAPLAYAPPPGLGPIQAGVVWDMTITDQAVSATVLDLADRGLVRLEERSDSVAVIGLESPGWSDVDVVSAAFANRIKLPEGGTIRLPARPPKDDKKLRLAVEAAHDALVAWDRETGFYRATGEGCVLMAVSFLACFFGTFGLMVRVGLTLDSSTLDPFLLPAPLLAFGFTSAVVLNSSHRARGPRADDVAQRLGGFRRVLATPSAARRAEWAIDQQLYFRYLPWAVVLGCADEWEKTYGELLAGEAPTPVWLHKLPGVAPTPSSTRRV